MNKDLIEQIAKQYPWVTEETLGMIMAATGKSQAKKAALAMVVNKQKNGDIKLDALLDKIENEIEADVKDAKNQYKNILNVTKKSSTSAIGAKSIGDLYSIATDTSLLDAADELAMAIPVENTIAKRFGAKIAGVVKGITRAQLIVAGVAMMVRAAMAKEKELRDVLDFGLGSENTNWIQNYKNLSKELGGEMDTFTDIISEAIPLMAGLENSALGGAYGLTAYISKAERANKEAGTGDFGYTMEQFSKRIADEAIIFAKLGEITSTEDLNNRQFSEALKSSEDIAMYLASELAIQRSEIIENRKEFFTNIDFVSAWQQSTGDIISMYGEEGARQLRDNYEAAIATMRELGLPQEEIDALQQAGNRAIRDIDQNTSILDNLSKEQKELFLTRLGPEGLSFLNEFDAILGGEQVSTAEVRARIAGRIKDLRDRGTILRDGSAASEAAATFLTSTMGITDEVLNVYSALTTRTEADRTEQQRQVEVTDTVIDSADSLNTATRIIDKATDMHLSIATSIGEFTSFMGETFNDISQSVLGDGPAPTDAEAQAETERRSTINLNPTPISTGTGMFNNTSTRAMMAMDYFVSQGLTREQSAGLVGNLMVESYDHLDHTAVGDGGRAYGIAQWHAPRQADFQAWAGKSIRESTFMEQLQFIMHELDNKESRAGNALRQATSASEAARVVQSLYERSAGYHIPSRVNKARQMDEAFLINMAPVSGEGSRLLEYPEQEKLRALIQTKSHIESGLVRLSDETSRLEEIARIDAEISEIQTRVNERVKRLEETE